MKAQRTLDTIDIDGNPFRATIRTRKLARGWLSDSKAHGFGDVTCYYPTSEQSIAEVVTMIERRAARWKARMAASYTSPPIESDAVQSARDKGQSVLFRVLAPRADGSYGRLCHYMGDDPAHTLGMAQQLAASRPGALVERIDVAAGVVVGAAMGVAA